MKKNSSKLINILQQHEQLFTENVPFSFNFEQRSLEEVVVLVVVILVLVFVLALVLEIPRKKCFFILQFLPLI